MELELERLVFALISRFSKFRLGSIFVTKGIQEYQIKYGIDLCVYLSRHAQGDWGCVSKDDAIENDNACWSGDRLLSSYKHTLDNNEVIKLWIITEANRSMTTILLPEEY